MSSRNRALGTLRLVALWACILLILWASRPTALALAAGAPIVAIGESIRLWAAGYLKKSVELAIDGPYRFTRNPLYLGRWLILTGILTSSPLPAYGHWILLVLGWAIFFGYYLPRKERVEPQRLEQIHGETYRRYREAVPALWPSWRPYPPGSGHWSLGRMARNREHWMVIGLAAYIAIQIYRVSLS